MFERFTDRARRVVVLAQEEARELGHNYIGTEHILLGLLRETDGVAAQALVSLEIGLEAVRQQVEEIIGRGDTSTLPSHIPFTPRTKKALELSLREALQLGHNYIGTEHILLGLLREGEGVAALVLVRLGADLNRVRQQVIQLLQGYQGKEPESSAVAGEGPAMEARARARAAHPAAGARVGSRFQLEGLTARSGEMIRRLDAIMERLGSLEERLASIEGHLAEGRRPAARAPRKPPAARKPKPSPPGAEPGDSGESPQG